MHTPSPLLAVLAGLLLLAGCQGDAGPVAETEEPAALEAPVAATPTPSPTIESPPPAEPPPTDAPGPAEEPGSDPVEVEVELTTVASGLEAPWEVVITDDGRAFVAERDSGAVLELDRHGMTTPVATLDVDAAGEGGLLGLAVDPAADPPHLYAYHTGAGDNRVVRFALGQEPEVVLDGIPKARIHNGGRLAFGPDGMLYVATGDAGQPALAQDEGSLAGKILRIRPDGGIPQDNPFGNEVWSLGHRNVQGLDWTAEGALYAAEFGPDVDDEVNRIEPGGNYGWPAVTGEANTEPYLDPVFVRQPSEASWSGLAILRGGAIPQWEGSVLLAALRGERLWRLTLDDDGGVADSEALFVGELGRLRQVVQTPDGALWILTSNRDGRGSPAIEDDRILRLGPGTR